jgi:uncharacterized protein (DUF4415 family)
MNGEDMNKAEIIPSVEEQIDALKNIKDEDIDFSDIPEILDWSNSVRGKFFRPAKTSVTLQLDADVLDWFKANHLQYQSAINSALRQFVHAQH